MSEPASAALAAGSTRSAGALLREAREAQGLPIEALAASIKVTSHKLELLEADRFDELPDATFARALAQTVCRALKIDSAPVMRLLPPLGGYRLEQVDEGLNTPFRDRPGQFVPQEWALLANPALWIAVVFVLAVLAVYLLPAGWFGMAATRHANAAGGASSSSAAMAVSTGSPSGLVETRVPTPLAPETPAAAAPVAASTSASMVRLQASAAASWVEVTDAGGRVLIGRSLQAGESIGVDGELPMRVRIGNAATTQLSFRGAPMPLASYTRDNVARLELK